MIKNIFSLLAGKLNPYMMYIKIAAAAAIVLIISFYMLKAAHYESKATKLAAQNEILVEKNKEWKESHKQLQLAAAKQNKYIEELHIKQKAALLASAEANKKARAIVAQRERQKNAAKVDAVKITTCDDAVNRAKADLVGSLL